MEERRIAPLIRGEVPCHSGFRILALIASNYHLPEIPLWWVRVSPKIERTVCLAIADLFRVPY